MISTDDKDVYEFCKSLRSHGWTRELENNDNYKNTYESKFKIHLNSFFQVTMLGPMNLMEY